LGQLKLGDNPNTVRHNSCLEQEELKINELKKIYKEKDGNRGRS